MADSKEVASLKVANRLLKRKCERYHEEVEGYSDLIHTLKSRLGEALGGGEKAAHALEMVDRAVEDIRRRVRPGRTE